MCSAHVYCASRPSTVVLRVAKNSTRWVQQTQSHYAIIRTLIRILLSQLDNTPVEQHSNVVINNIDDVSITLD